MSSRTRTSSPDSRSPREGAGSGRARSRPRSSGEGLDSVVFSTIAFAGTGIDLANQIVTIWAIKVAWEVAATPLTYGVVNYLKRVEGVDVYDVDTDFSPFVFRR